MDAPSPISARFHSDEGFREESGALHAVDQSLEDIERELNERLAKLGLPTLSGSGGVPTRETGVVQAGAGKATQTLDLRELRSALRQQIRIAEIKEQVTTVIREWNSERFQTGELRISEFEVRAAGLLIPYCREFIPNFPDAVRPVELAMDLDLEGLFRSFLPRGGNRELTPDEIEECAVEIIQALLKHPLIPRDDADRAEVNLKTTTLKDKNGTAVYSPSDANFLKHLIEERELLDRDGEVGLLAMLISGRKWNKIDSDALFVAAVEYTLEALAKKRGVPTIILRSQGPDHPVAYILREYVQHHPGESLEAQIQFVEDFIAAARGTLAHEGDAFNEAIRREFVPRLRAVFLDLLPEAITRFLHAFEREFLDSSRTERSKLFLFKRVGDFCELAFYCNEALRSLRTATGDIYAAERLGEGTEHFAVRNNLPLAEGMDFFNRKNTLAELLMNAIKFRRNLPLPVASANGGEAEARRQAENVLMSDLLNCLNQLRRVFDHNYARGRENNYENYARWRELVLEWSRVYARLLTGRTLNDVERYRIDSLATWHVESELAFVNLHLPSVFRQSQELNLEYTPRMRQPEDIIKENFLRFWRGFHIGVLTNAQSDQEEAEKVFTPDAAARHSARLSSDDLSKRAFLARSDLPLGIYTLEVLASYLAPETLDHAVLTQALEVGLELANKAYVFEETSAVRVFLKQLQQRLELLVILSDIERTEYRERIANTIRDLDRREPLQMASSIVALSELESVQLTDERVLEEWKNVETGIQRMQQITATLVLTRKRREIRELADKFSQWLSVAPISSESPRRRTFDKRLREIQRVARSNALRYRGVRVWLGTVWNVQSVAAVHDWKPPETYILEDFLSLETPPRRIRDLETAMAARPVGELRNVLDRIKTTFAERTGAKAGPSYYTPEEQSILRERIVRLEALSARSAWTIRRTRWLYRVLRTCTSPFLSAPTTR